MTDMVTRVKGYVEIDDGQIIFRLDDLAVIVSAETAIIYRHGSGIPAERVKLGKGFWEATALREPNEEEKKGEQPNV